VAGGSREAGHLHHIPGPHAPAAGSERGSFGAERVKGEGCLESSSAGKVKEHWGDHDAPPAQASLSGSCSESRRSKQDYCPLLGISGTWQPYICLTERDIWQ